jgi:hypothetical protein
MIAPSKFFKIEEWRDSFGVVGIALASPNTASAPATSGSKKLGGVGTYFLLSLTWPSVAPPANTRVEWSDLIAPTIFRPEKETGPEHTGRGSWIMPPSSQRSSYRQARHGR